jgi:enamine deaminase RidA (YjgF/YER057c/UK114 family)
MSKIEARLKTLGVTLAALPPAAAAPVPYKVSGNTVYISGQVPLQDGEIKYIGKLGRDMNLETGRAAARLCAINVVAALKAACGGDLDRVTQCLKLTVFQNCTADYTQQPEVAHGASDFMVEVFGEAGRHARSAVGMGSLPRGVAVEVEAIFEIK